MGIRAKPGSTKGTKAEKKPPHAIITFVIKQNLQVESILYNGLIHNAKTQMFSNACGSLKVSLVLRNKVSITRLPSTVRLQASTLVLATQQIHQQAPGHLGTQTDRQTTQQIYQQAPETLRTNARARTPTKAYTVPIQRNPSKVHTSKWTHCNSTLKDVLRRPGHRQKTA